MESKSVRKVDIINILAYMVKKWYIIIVVGIVFAAVAGGNGLFKYKVAKSNQDYANANYIAPIYGSFTVYISNYDGSENYYNRIEDVTAIVKDYDSLSRLCSENNIDVNYYSIYNCVTAVSVGINMLEISVEGSLIGYDQEAVVELATDLRDIVMDTFNSQLGEGSVVAMDEPHAGAYVLEKSMTVDESESKVITKKDVFKYALIGGVIGCVLGAVAVLFYMLLSTVLRCEQEVVECYKLPLLGRIGRNADDNKEEYRRILSNYKACGVTALISATDNEYRDEAAGILARMSAVNGKKTVFIDIVNGDNAAENDLYKICMGEDVKKFIRNTDKETLKKLVYTQASDDNIDLFTNAGFKESLAQLKEMFDYVFISCPAMNDSAAALNIAAVCDSTVAVAASKVITEEEVNRIKQCLSRCGVTCSGLIYVK